jgi:hypothetical protein
VERERERDEVRPSREKLEEEHLFDDMTRGLASGTVSRGQTLKLVGAGILGSLGLTALFPGVAEAKTYTAGKGLKLTGNQFSLANRGVTTAKIADDAVTGAKIANITRGITANLMGHNSESGINGGGFGVRLTSSGGSVVLYTFMVPYDYAGDDLTIREWWHQHDASGTAKVVRWISKLTADGQDIGLESATPFDVTTACCIPSRTWDILADLVAPGDIFWVEMERSGDHPDDTMGRLDLRAVAVEYQADQ